MEMTFTMATKRADWYRLVQN